MVILRKINGVEIAVNAELIESVEASPDTVLNMVTGNRFIVKDSVQDVIDKVIEYRKQVYSSKSVVNPLEGYEKKP